jgi:ATP synthase protein I
MLRALTAGRLLWVNFGSLLGEAFEARGMSDNDPADLRSLDAQLKAARERSPTPESRSKKGDGDRSGMAIGLRLSAELIAGLLFGLGVGWLLDRWLGTAPWLLLVFMLLGIAAGIMNVIRTGNRANEPTEKE